jgi:hypothetical protein
LHIYIGKYEMPKRIAEHPWTRVQYYKPGNHRRAGVHPSGEHRMLLLEVLPVLRNHTCEELRARKKTKTKKTKATTTKKTKKAKMIHGARELAA